MRPPSRTTACASVSAMVQMPPARCTTPRRGRSSAAAAYSALAWALVVCAEMSNCASTNSRSRSGSPTSRTLNGRSASTSSVGGRAGRRSPPTARQSPSAPTARRRERTAAARPGSAARAPHGASAVRSCQRQTATALTAGVLRPHPRGGARRPGGQRARHLAGGRASPAGRLRGPPARRRCCPPPAPRDPSDRPGVNPAAAVAPASNR